MISIYKSTFDKKGLQTTADVVMGNIQRGEAIKKQIEHLRALQTKEERSDFKVKNLPAVTWSGTFSERKAAALIEHSKLICLDIDALEEEQLNNLRSIVYTDLYVYAAFVSPSGNGLKVIICIDVLDDDLANGGYKDVHLSFFNQLTEYAKQKWSVTIDPSGKDVSRLCYLSSDAEAYYNPDSTPFPYNWDTEEQSPEPPKLFFDVTENPDYSTEEKPAPTAQKKEQDDWKVLEETVLLLEQHRLDITDNYPDWVKIGMALASMGEAARSYFHRVSALSSKYDAAATDKKFDDALQKGKNITVASFYFYANPALEPYKKSSKPKNTRPKAAAQGEHQSDNETETEALAADFIYPVWDKYGMIKDLKIDNVRLLEICRALGFVRLELAEGTVFVQKKGAILHKVERKHIIDALFDYLYGLPEDIVLEHIAKGDDGKYVSIPRKMLINKVMAGQGTYLSEDKLLHLRDPQNDYARLRHTQHEAWFFYANGGVRIDAGEVVLIPYEKLPGFVWAGNAHKRTFKKADYSNFTFKKFVWNITNGKDITGEEAEKRYLAMRTLIGYLLHSFFKTKLSAIAFTDSRISDKAEGRSGKTLLCDSMSHMLNAEVEDHEPVNKFYEALNGKDFNPEDRFRYQTLNPQTVLVVINDLQRNFNVENLFNDITDGLQSQQKTAMPIRIRAKMAITCNQTLKIEGGSAKHRVIQCELADYYSANYEPSQEFGEWFFRDWTPEQWQMFDSFMLDCVALYFKHGVIVPSTINLEQRNLLDRTNEEFVNWWNDAIEKEQIKPGREYDKKELFDDFKKPYDEKDFKYLTAKLFTNWLRLASEVTPGFGLVKKEHERKSSGKNMIKFPQFVSSTPEESDEKETPKEEVKQEPVNAIQKDIGF